MSIHLFMEEDRRRWDKYVMSSNISTCYHLSGWKDVIEGSFGHKTYYLLAENNKNEIEGILPLVHLKSRLFGSFMVSLPYFNYGGACAENDEASKQLLGKASYIGAKEEVAHIELRHANHIFNDLQVKTAKVSMRLELPEKSDDLWSNFPSKLRSQVRRPAKEGMCVKIGGEDELDSFYTVFSINMRDLGTPVYSKRFFRNILKTFPENSWICSVYTKDGHPAASGFLIGFKERLEIPWASSIREYNRFGPNMLLYWSSLKSACEKGYKVFDFGRSTPGEGTCRFKEQWGAKPHQLYWHYWLRNGGPLPELNPNNPKYYMAIRVWQRLPVALTKLLGPVIVKNIP